MTRRTRRAALAVAMAMVCTVAATGSALAAPRRSMDIRDVVEVRQVAGTQVAPDGRRAAVVVTEPSVATNTITSRVLVFDLAAPERVREMASVSGAADRITNLRWRPDGHSLTYIAPLDGVDEVWTVPVGGGRAERLFAAPGPAIAVGGNRALRGAGAPPHQAKVLAHEWSPNGRQVVFAVPLPPAEHTLDGVPFDDRTTLEGILTGSYYPPRVGLRLWDAATGRQRALTELEMGRASYAPRLVWSPDGARLAIGNLTLTTLDVRSGATRVLDERWSPFAAVAWTPDGRRVVVQSSARELSGIPADGGEPRVLATLPEGLTQLSDIALAPDRVVVAALSGRDSRAIYAGPPGTTLARVTPQHTDVGGCAFDGGRENAVCVRQTNVSAPKVATLRADGTLRDGYDPNHRLRDRRVFAPVAATWTNAKGQTANGYRIVPDGCGNGRRCPAVVITHGFDARNRFMWQDHEWDYPSQVFAANGYVVLLVNEPSGAEPQDAVSTMESAVRDAVDRGEVDPNRAGIAGYSRGAQITQRALAISTVFRAGSSGDGGDGGPDGPGSGEPIKFPLLAQVTEAIAAMLLPVIRDLRARNIPTEMVLFPDETHTFHQPRHREAAMRQNLDWFAKHLG